MKNITSLFTMAMLSTMSLSVMNSCTNDDLIVITPESIEGTWMHDDSHDNEYDYLLFNADGTGSKWEIHKGNPNAAPHDKEDFSYSLSDGKITFYEPDGERDTESIRMNNPNEIVIDHDTYKRQQP